MNTFSDILKLFKEWLTACEDSSGVWHELLEEELSFFKILPLEEGKSMATYIMTSYFLVKSYQGEGKYSLSPLMKKKFIKDIAYALREEKESGNFYLPSSQSLNEKGFSLSFLTDKNGNPLSRVNTLLKEMDKYRIATHNYESRGYLR